MTTTSIHITKADHQKLTELLRELTPETGRLPEHLQPLADELERAELKESVEISNDIVTLYSKVRVRESGEDMEFTLVPPEEANIDVGRISIFAPLVMAALGCRIGDTFEWSVDGGKCSAKVEDFLFQPEEKMRENSEQ